MNQFTRIARGALCSAALLAAWATPSIAWDGSATGKISVTEITHGANFGFRVWLAGTTTPICTGGQPWGYVNESDSNYKTYVAALMLAKAMAQTVTLYLTTENGFCHIGHVAVG